MEESLSQVFENSRKASGDYLEYLTQQENEKSSKQSSNDLDAIIERINATGTVSAMAAKESMVSHNSIFQMLHVINKVQGALLDLVIDLRLNGSSGGESEGGAINGAITAGELAAGAKMSNPWIAAAAIVGAIIGDIPQQDAEDKNQAELDHPNSLTNKALKAQQDANRLIGTIDYSLNPAPNPLMNGPGAVQTGAIYKDLPFTQTPGEAFSVVAAINEANDYLESTGQIAPRANMYEGFDVDYNDTPDISNLMKYNFINGITDQKPQSVVQIVTQQPAAESAAPQQTVNLNLQNDFKGNWQDRRQLDDVGEALARQIMDRLNSGGMLYSNNW